MKKIIAIAVASAAVGIAYADFIVDVTATFGFYNKDGVNGIIGAVGQTATVELLYVGADGVPNYLDANNNILPGGVGDDVLLGTFTVLNSGGAFEDFAFFDPVKIQAPGLGGQVFGRIWWTQDPSVGGAWYYQGYLELAENKNPVAVPPPVPTLYIMDQGLDGQIANFGQVIPEPGTIGLLGVAGIGMFLARRKTRR